MPIYAYKCTTCGFAKDTLRKLSDPPLTQCPSCGAETFVKQVTAAGFQLKGSGWYVTDFRDNGAAKSKDKPADDSKAGDTAVADKPASEGGAKGEGAPAKSPAGDADKPAPAAASAPAPAAAPAPASNKAD